MLLLLTFVTYRQTILYLIGKWNQLEIGEYGHGYLVLAISAYLVFYNRLMLVALTPCPEHRAILAVVSACMLWLIAALVDIEVLQAVGLLLLVLSILWALLGSQVTRILVFPVIYIGFAIPIWFPLSPILQDLTADAVFWIIRVMEIPALRIENMIVLPAGKLSIEEACSGLRYFLAALTLGSLYGYLNYVNFRARLFVLLVAAGAAVLANMLRVFIVVYLAYKTDMQHPLVHDHLYLGWYIFGGLVVVLLTIDARLHRNRLPGSNGTVDTAATKQVPCNKGKSQIMVSVLVVALLVSAGPGIIFWLSEQPQLDNKPVKIEFPSATVEWPFIGFFLVHKILRRIQKIQLDTADKVFTRHVRVSWQKNSSPGTNFHQFVVPQGIARLVIGPQGFYIKMIGKVNQPVKMIAVGVRENQQVNCFNFLFPQKRR